MQRIAIIGFGFSGLMVTANLVRMAQEPLTLYIIDEHADGLGTAYGTSNPLHLLNVRAGNMSAYADAADHFVQWLQGDEAGYEAATLGITTRYAADDFVPRALYGRYLQSIWRTTQEIAAQKKLSVNLVPSCAVAVNDGATPAVLTARGDAIAVDAMVLGVGHEMKPVLANLRHAHIIQSPWSHDVFTGAALWQSPVMVMGSGLTAIDILLSLRKNGYSGEVILASRHGWLPHTHVKPTRSFSFSAEQISEQTSLFKLLRMVQTNIREQHEWRIVLDALRQYTASIWQRLTMRDKQRFLKSLLPLWNVHRHRMAPEIAARIEEETSKGILRVMRSNAMHFSVNDAQRLLVTNGNESFNPSRIINGTGLELNVEKSSNVLLKQLLAQRHIEAHATGLGIAADPHYRAWGHLHPNLYVLGSLLTGQLLESTAVPELRVQAEQIATNLLA